MFSFATQRAGDPDTLCRNAVSPSLDSDDLPPPEYPPALLLVSSDTSPAEDIKRFLFQGSDIVIGTPGRIEEHLLGKGKGIVNVKELEILVLDEADFPRTNTNYLS